MVKRRRIIEGLRFSEGMGFSEKRGLVRPEFQ